MQGDINEVIATFRFPNPATTSMGIEFSDSEGGSSYYSSSDVSEGVEDEEDEEQDKRQSTGSNFNPFKPVLNPKTKTKKQLSMRFSSADLHNQITALEQLMAESGFNDQELDVAKRRKSSQVVVEEFLSKDAALNQGLDHDLKKSKRDSYRKSTQSLLQFLLDSRQAVNMAASSPLPSSNNIFRGTDFVVKNANRMSTAISFQGSNMHLPDYDSEDDDYSSFRSHSEHIPDPVEMELMGALDSEEEEEEDNYDDQFELIEEAMDTVSPFQPTATESIRSSINNNSSSNSRLTPQLSPNYRLCLDGDPAFTAMAAEPTNAPQPANARIIRPRVSTLKRPSIDMSSPTMTSSPSPTQSIATSPTLSPEAKRRRSVPTVQTLANQQQPTVGIPASPRPPTVRRPPTNATTAATAPAPKKPQTLLNILTHIPLTHVTRPSPQHPQIQTLLHYPPRAQLSVSTIINELQQASNAWHAHDRLAALYKLHACAVSPWLRKIHDPESTPGGITRSTVHPSAVALYILAMCLLEGVAGACRKDEALGVLVLEMAAGVAVGDGGGRGENALKQQMEMLEEEQQSNNGSIRSGNSSHVSEGVRSVGSSSAATVVVGSPPPPHHAHPQRRGSLKEPSRSASMTKRSLRGDSKKASEEMQGSSGLQQSGSRQMLQHFTLVDPAWSLIETFHQPEDNNSINGDVPPTPTRVLPVSPRTTAAGNMNAKRVSYLQSLTPLEFLRLPTLRLAECYELGRGVKKSRDVAKNYYRAWNSLGGAHGFQTPTPPGSVAGSVGGGGGHTGSIANRSSFSSTSSARDSLNTGTSIISTHKDLYNVLKMAQMSGMLGDAASAIKRDEEREIRKKTGMFGGGMSLHRSKSKKK
ncbi:UNVERIFIED_CONTAM: hypothetical protein HDU68_009860 [Siphonaria sp. JEL0065]|nr:hypothetical protein HDU68_009860 [Siphonaria sp. JEL0065]